MVERQPWAQESTDVTLPLISSPESQCPQSVSNGTEKTKRGLCGGGPRGGVRGLMMKTSRRSWLKAGTEAPQRAIGACEGSGVEFKTVGVRVPSTLTPSSPETNGDVVSTVPHLHGEQRPLTGREGERGRDGRDGSG